MERVVCSNCKTEFEDDPDVILTRWRKPCPFCGSTSRLFSKHLEGHITPHSKLKYKGRRGGIGKPFIIGTVGADFYRKLQKWMRLERVIDRENDQYTEVITDPSTGEHILQCDEPLTKHQGHGLGTRRKTDNTR